MRNRGGIVIARAPGKVVLAGAYAVLEGAEALVAAVDRYVVADTGRPADRITPEVQAALRERGLGDEYAPWFDASALRSGGAEDRKLGLGSSAAIVVASLAALAPNSPDTPPSQRAQTLADAIFAPALHAHRIAQGGGSGIDVAASAYGGILRCRRQADGLAVRPTRLPPGIVMEVWASARAASTAGLVKMVRAWAVQNGSAFRRAIDAIADTAAFAIAAVEPGPFLEAYRGQFEALDRLGRESGTPIVTPDVRAFDDVARTRSAVVIPSGAGGGDVALWVGTAASDPSAREVAQQAGLQPLEATVGAQGVHSLQTAVERDPNG